MVLRAPEEWYNHDMMYRLGVLRVWCVSETRSKLSEACNHFLLELVLEGNGSVMMILP